MTLPPLPEPAEMMATLTPDGVIEVPHFTADQMRAYGEACAAAERERMDLNAIHSCHAECQNPFCVRVREAVAHEREACAKFLIDLYESDGGYHPAEEFAKNAAAVIRARGAV